MPKVKMLVYTNSLDGEDEEFNRWYDEVHLPEIVKYSAAVAAQRFCLSEVQWDEPGSHKYLAIYEFDVDSKQASDSLKANMSKIDRSGSRSTNETKIVFYDAIGERITE